MRNFFSMVVTGLLALAGTGLAHAQQAVPVRLTWGSYANLPTADPDAPRRTPTFRGAYHGTADAVGTYTQRLPGAVSSVSLADAVYEPYSAADLRLLGNAALPAAPTVRLRSATEARQPITFALVQPARRNPQTGQPERLVSFTLTYQPDATALGRGGSGTAARSHVSASVLSSGDWFKIGVPRSGVYKLDRATLQSLGLPVTSLDPRKVQLFGNAMGLLPQANAAPRPDDLAENNILFVGNTNSTFDDGEYFLFYAKGPHTWRASQPGRTSQPLASQLGYLGEGGRFKHLNNVYCDTAYYFVRVGTADGRRVPAAPAPTAAPSGAAITTFLDRRFYEHDLLNLLHSGRSWVGESFSSTTGPKEFSFSKEGYPALADLVAGDSVWVTAALAAAGSQSSSFTVALNGTTLGAQGINSLPSCLIQAVGANSFQTYVMPRMPAGFTDPKVTLTFSSYDATATGYLDYLELVVKRQLNFTGSYLEFNSLNNVRGVGTARTFTLSNASGAQVWDVTNPRRPLSRALSGGSFVAPTDSLREYVAVLPTGTDFGTPRLFGRVANQNLHQQMSTSPDLVIVTHPVFQAVAEKLAQHRRDFNGLTVVVVTTPQVYNEYSSGGQDVTAIRDMMKQVYDSNPSPATRRTHLLLLGDASFDYKSSWQNDASKQPDWWSQRAPFKTTADFNKANQNYVPTYESRESFLAVSCSRDNAEGENSFSSEDYYGLLDDTEGNWVEAQYSTYPFETTDIAIGRIPVRTPANDHGNASDALAVVQKIIDYDATVSFGKWRNYMTLTADDGDNNNYANESENPFAANISASEPAYNLRKAYLDLFPQISVAAGQRSPDCVAAIDNALEQGSLLIGYTGHGGPGGLANEQIITKASLLALRNQNRLTFLVTGTCDLSTYDNPDYTSAGESVLTDNLSAGAVGLFTTTRVVLSTYNTEVVNSFYTQVLTRNAAGNLPTIGFAASVAKNNQPSGDLNNRNYTLLADPSGQLAYPRQRVVVDSINGHRVQSVTVSLDTLQALRRVRISGHVENRGALNTSFNGTASITIFDKPIIVKTLGDEIADTSRVRVRVQNTVIYDGQASVTAGRWSTSLVVPKDIAYAVANGKISLYAADYTQKIDAQGYQLVPVGGAASRVPADTRPPRITLFMTDEVLAPNDTSFVSGGNVNRTSLLVGHLRDESGINTSNASVGHDLTATLDGDPVKLVVLNSAYTADVNRYTSGKVRYLYKDLATGLHTVTMKAWDTYNNSSEARLDFVVASTEQLALTHVLNYPNPFVGSTTFQFDHNRPGQAMDVQVQIFTIAGRLVKTLRASYTTSAGLTPTTAHVPATLNDAQLTWNGLDDYQDKLARGVYVYRISIRTGEQTATKYEKLVLLN